jgi:hypothetical protein
MSVEECYEKLIKRGNLHTAGIRAGMIQEIVKMCDKIIS